MSIQSTTTGLAALHNYFRTAESLGSFGVNSLSFARRNSGSNQPDITLANNSATNAIRRLTTKINQVGASQLVQPLTNPQPTQISDSASQTSSGSSSRIAITGVNAQQIAKLNVVSLGAQGQFSLDGSVNRAADYASLTIVGGNSTTVTASGQYLLSGSLGTSTVSLTAGESLDSVASRINQQTSQTGVIASVRLNSLVLTSKDVGSKSIVSFRQAGPAISSVSGLDPQKITSFNVLSQTAGTTDTITGTVTSSAGQAKLVYRGDTGGTVKDNATFRLTGSRGSIDVSMTKGESLADVASRINQATSSSGVIAAVDGNDLKLTSDSSGSSATVQIDGLQQENFVTVSGNNPSEISDVVVSSFDDDSTQTLSGTIDQSATAASVALQGSTSGNVIDSATFQLTGSLGTSTISVTQGESLTNVAARVNSLTSSTGVKAEVSSNQLVLKSTDIGSGASVAVHLADITHANTASGIDSQQLSNFQINSLNTGASETLSGTIDQAAEAASIALQGSSGKVIDSATFQLTGSLGTSSISITQGESLDSVASRINSLTSSTGVQAEVNSDQLVLKSIDIGGDANIAVRLTDITHTNIISGVDSQQLSNFQINSLTAGTSETLSGTINQSATAASVALQGSTSGTVIDTATFQLTGSHGSSSISITQGESLTSVASRVNALTSTTGVQATISSNQLVLKSSDVGSTASVAVQLTDITHTNVVSGVNSQQLSNFQINSLATGASETLSGTINQSATAASVALQGSTSGTVIDTATFQLTGSRGASSISITQGESLASIASRVNALTSTTGVQATVSSNQLVLNSSDVGSSASVAVQLTNITHTNVATGVNSQQLSNFQINSLTTGASETLSGTVNQTATAASVALQGSASGTVIDTATFQLTGSLGASSISITQGESLTSVASRVNSLTSTTGVQATVSSNQLVLKSSNVGSTASVAVQLTNITHTNVVTGVNSQQLSNFQVNSFTTDASQTFNGSVTQTAGNGQLTFTGSLGFVGKNSTFTLTGSQGSVQLTTSSLQSLSTLASQVNAATATTGVQATVSGSQLIFKTVGVGSSATIGINVTSGTFGVTGGNGNGTANGTNAVAVINGQAITGSGNSFQFSDSKGSYAFTTVAGFTGTLSAVNVTSQAGQFNVTGGNGNGTANGTNAVVTINGQTVTGTGNSFQFSDSKGSYSFSTVAGYTGALNSINVASQAGQFSVTGGHGDGTANGTNAVATINGQTVNGTGNSFQFSDSKGSFAFTSVAGFTGTLNSINVASQAGQFSVTGGHGDGTANGTNAVATINGQTVTGTGNSFQFSDSDGSYAFTSVAGFTGALNSINVASQAGQFDLVGGNGDGTASGKDAIATINGQTVTGTGNSFQFSDSEGSYTFTSVAGFTGALNSINVASQAGQFDLVGGNGDGTASGTDAVATINGQTVTGTGNSFQFSDAKGTYAFTAADGFQGSLTPIVVRSNPGSFEIEGGDGNGTAHGSDFIANLNGVTQTSSNNRVTVVGNNGMYDLKFANGFVGGISVTSVAKADSVDVIGGGSTNTAYGIDAQATINGQDLSGDGSTFNIHDQGSVVTVAFAPGFTGQLNSVSVNRTVSTEPDINAAAIGAVSDPTSQSSVQAQQQLVLQLAQQDINFGYILNKLKQLQTPLHQTLAAITETPAVTRQLLDIENERDTSKQTSKDESSETTTRVARDHQADDKVANQRIDALA